MWAFPDGYFIAGVWAFPNGYFITGGIVGNAGLFGQIRCWYPIPDLIFIIIGTLCLPQAQHIFKDLNEVLNELFINFGWPIYNY